MKFTILLLHLIFTGLLLVSLPAFAADNDTLMPRHPATPSPAADLDIHDIYGPVPLPDPVNRPLYLSAAVAALAIVALIWFYLKRRRPKEIPPVAPHLTALAELALARGYLEEEQPLQYAARVSGILRGYIEQRFSIRSTRQTTSEFLASIEHQSAQASTLQPFATSLEQCLGQCDLAKYAHKKAGRQQMEEMEKSIRQFIENTTAEEK
jgi:hypothetical protein